MRDRQQQLKKARLYLVLDRQVQGYEQLFDVLRQAVPAGVDIVQLRDKTGSARDIVEFAQKALRYLHGRIPFIVNDRVDLALAVGADGVHLGQEDLPLEKARSLAGKKFFIGISCQTLSQACLAQKQGADYLGFGSVFPTLTKPDRPKMDLRLLTKVLKSIDVPVFSIGGISLDNIAQLSSLGVRRVAVTRAICLAKNVAATTKLLRKTIE